MYVLEVFKLGYVPQHMGHGGLGWTEAGLFGDRKFASLSVSRSGDRSSSPNKRSFRGSGGVGKDLDSCNRRVKLAAQL